MQNREMTPTPTHIIVLQVCGNYFNITYKNKPPPPPNPFPNEVLENEEVEVLIKINNYIKF